MTVNTIDSGTKAFDFWPCVRVMIAPQIHHLFLLTIISGTKSQLSWRVEKSFIISFAHLHEWKAVWNAKIIS
ncbi:hypothetical protein HN51_024517 [Arachis hypogaea]